MPGTERMILLSNPTEMFGDLEMQDALQSFRAGAYDAALVRYDDLSSRISEPTEARFMRDLSELYRPGATSTSTTSPTASTRSIASSATRG